MKTQPQYPAEVEQLKKNRQGIKKLPKKAQRAIKRMIKGS